MRPRGLSLLHQSPRKHQPDEARGGGNDRARRARVVRRALPQQKPRLPVCERTSQTQNTWTTPIQQNGKTLPGDSGEGDQNSRPRRAGAIVF